MSSAFDLGEQWTAAVGSSGGQQRCRTQHPLGDPPVPTANIECHAMRQWEPTTDQSQGRDSATGPLSQFGWRMQVGEVKEVVEEKEGSKL